MEKAPPIHQELNEVPVDDDIAIGGGDDIAEVPDLDEASEWRLQVQVLSFQRSTFPGFLFVARNESVADFMVRAGILLKP